MAETLADLAEQSSDRFEGGVLKKFARQSNILDRIPVVKTDSDIYKYRQQETLPGIQNRAVNQAYSESTGRLATRTEDLSIFGGEMFRDRALGRFEKSGGDSIDWMAEQISMKTMALGREVERQIFEGDKLVNPLEMQGLRARLTGDQAQLAGSGGATITLAMVDALIDSVAMGTGKPYFYTSKAVRRKWTTLAKASGGSVSINYASVDKLGEQIAMYDGIPIEVVEDPWDAATILNAEDPGDGTADTYSIYLINFGVEEGVSLLVNGEGPLVQCYQVTKETEQGPPGEKWRLETYIGMMRRHPRSAARLYGLLLA